MTEAPRVPVLIIEFDTLQRDLMALALNRGPYRPIVCDDLARVRELIREHQPRILLIDLYLPGINGLSLLRELSVEGLVKDCAVVAISSMGYPEVVSQAVRAGVDDFLVKPIQPDLLLSRIQKVVDKALLT